MTEDERQNLLREVTESHATLSEVALKLRRELPSKSAALKTALKAERASFDLKHALQLLVVEDLAQTDGRAPLPRVRRGMKVVDVQERLRSRIRQDES